MAMYLQFKMSEEDFEQHRQPENISRSENLISFEIYVNKEDIETYKRLHGESGLSDAEFFGVMLDIVLDGK